jgi:glycosyltransferase involved in cell wall biosynthesis
MRVLHLADGLALRHELGRHLSLLLRGLASRGIDVTLLTSPDAPPDFAEGIQSVHARSVLALRRIIIEQRPDVVHLHAPFLLAVLAVLLTRVPLVVSPVGARDYVPLRTWLVRARARRVIDGSICVDLANLDSPDELGVEALRKAYAAPLVLCMGHLEKEDSLDTLLQAWAELPTGTLLLVGGGEESLKRKAGELNLTARIAFLSPPSTERLPNLYHAADVFVQPSLRQGVQRLSLLEAQACGLPTIEVGDEPGEQAGGLIAPPGQVEPLADGLRRLLTDEALRRRLGGQGSARIRHDFSEERLVETVLGVYRSVLEPANK